MPTKIRLQRHGRKGYAFFHIVAADSRAPRDGKYIEKLGVYNPNTNPATIEIDLDGAVTWLENGAQPTDTCRAILSYKGVLYKKHLNGGVRKGAFSQEEADARFEKWLTEKNTKIDKGAESIKKAQETSEAERLKAEQEAKEAIAKKVAAKTSPLAEEVAEEGAEEATENAPEPEAADDAATAPEASVEPAAEAEKAEEPKAEEKSEEKAEEASDEEKKKAE